MTVGKLSNINEQKFRLMGPPVIQQRHRKGMYGQMYDPSSKEKEKISWELKAQRGRIFSGAIGVEVHFFGMPKGDLDNAIKALLDAANKILWNDDKQITSILATLTREDGNPRTEMTVMQL